MVTFLGFGALEIGRDWGIGADRSRPDESSAAEVLNGVLDLGINLIDTAAAYHRSEKRIGAALAHRRSEYVLASKCGEHNTFDPFTQSEGTGYDFSYEAIRVSILRSFELLKTNTIDLMQIHFGPDPMGVLDDGGCVQAMKEFQAEGRIRLLGASVDGEPLTRCIESGDFQVVQVGYSLLNVSQASNIKLAHQKGIGVLIRLGLAGGWLTSRALVAENRPAKVEAMLAEVHGNPELLTRAAYRFLNENEGVTSVLWGTKSMENLTRAVQIATKDEWDDELNSIYLKLVDIAQS